MDVSTVILGDPLFLLGLVPVLGVLLWRRVRRPATLDGGSAHVLGSLPRTWRTRLSWLPGAVLTLAALLVVVALARPLRGREEARVLTEGVDVMLVLDTSSSMLEQGLQKGLTNLEVVKEVVARFVQEREDDRLGLVSFAALPRTECPLTLDHGAVLQQLAALECVRPNGPEDGTGIGIALGHAARKLRDSDAVSKVVVLLTDGEENQYVVEPSDAAALCRDLGIKVYTIGAGVHVARGFFGGVQEVELPTGMLQDVASTTGGRFYRAKDAGSLEAVYGDIDALETTIREDVRYTDYDDLYPWLLIPAAALLALEQLLRRGAWLEITG